MFDKLIASEPKSADFKNRRGYFLVSTLMVGILFLTAVVISIYSADFRLGNEQFEIQAILTPVDITEPAPPKQRAPTSPTTSASQTPTRTMSIARTDEPTIAPTSTSTVANHVPSRPIGNYAISKIDSDPGLLNGSGRVEAGPGTGEIGIGDQPTIAENVKIPEPPPLKVPPAFKKDVVRSIGVINGKASYLPKPVYSTAAIAMNAQGKVEVQVTIDENGKVISASAVNGHPLLKAAAEKAAWNARFTTTYLSKVPVKVTGVIVYNFMR